jgi:SAM-dependent methyltransferase
MFDRSTLQQAWNRTHQEKPISDRPQEDVVAFGERLRWQLPSGARVLDTGCGRGRNTLHLAQMGFAVYGCDLSPVAIQVARQRIQKANATVMLQVADLTRLPFPDSWFEAAICVHVLSYQLKADRVQSVRELWRILKPGGWLYLDLLDCDDAEYGCGPELEEHTFGDPDGTPIHFSTRQEINELLQGFDRDRVARLELGQRPRVGWVMWVVKSEG